MRWTREIVDLTPQFCLRCEERVKSISLAYLFSTDVYLIRCGNCGYIMARTDAPTLKHPIQPV